LSVARPSSRPRPWPSVQSRRSTAPLPGPDSRPLCVRVRRISGLCGPRTGRKRPRTEAVGAVVPTVRPAFWL
jgi:hypothetical protein